MTRRGNVEKIILDFAKAVCEEIGGKRMNTPDARRIFEAIAMILSNRNDGVRVQLSEIKTKAAKAS